MHDILPLRHLAVPEFSMFLPKSSLMKANLNSHVESHVEDASIHEIVSAGF